MTLYVISLLIEDAHADEIEGLRSSIEQTTVEHASQHGFTIRGAGAVDG